MKEVNTEHFKSQKKEKTDPYFDISLVEIGLENVNAIDSMVAVDGKLYLGLSCMPPEYLLASFDPVSRAVEDCLVRFDGNKLHNALVRTKDGTLYGGTWSWIKVHDHDCRYTDFEGGHLFCYDPKTDVTTDLDKPYPHEQIFALVLSPCEQILYGITFPLKRFFAFNIRTKEMNDIVELRGALGDTTSHQIVCDNVGNVWGSQGHGYLFKYDVKKGRFIETSIRLPEGELHIDYIINDEKNNLLYGGTVQNGLFFTFDPVKENLKVIGKAGVQGRLPALAFDPEGKVYGATGSTVAHYFRFDPETEQLTDLGPIRDPQRDVVAYRIHSMVIDDRGNLYFGESDRYPYLFVCQRREQKNANK